MNRNIEKIGNKYGKVAWNNVITFTPECHSLWACPCP